MRYIYRPNNGRARYVVFMVHVGAVRPPMLLELLLRLVCCFALRHGRRPTGMRISKKEIRLPMV